MSDFEIIKSEAWIDFMPSWLDDKQSGGPNSILHVSLAIFTNNGIKYYLSEKITQGLNPSILELELQGSSVLRLEANPQIIHFSKAISVGYFSEIIIDNVGRMVTKITEIEIII